MTPLDRRTVLSAALATTVPVLFAHLGRGGPPRPPELPVPSENTVPDAATPDAAIPDDAIPDDAAWDDGTGDEATWAHETEDTAEDAGEDTGETTAAPEAVVVDGFAVTVVPPGCAPPTSEHSSSWEDVDSVMRVWERGPDDGGAFSVDLRVKVMRGEPLATAEQQREFLTTYHEVDDAVWSAFEHPDGPGWSRPGSASWWVSPGLGVEVALDAERFTDDQVADVARGTRPA